MAIEHRARQTSLFQCSSRYTTSPARQESHSAHTLHQMSQRVTNSRGSARPSAPAMTSNTSTESTKMETDDPQYPMTLFNIGLIMDRSGIRMPPLIKRFIEEKVINKKRRSSPPLSQENLDEVREIAENVANSSEGAVHRIFDTNVSNLA